LFPLFATGGKFAAGVVDAGGKLPPVSLTPAANLSPVSLTPVANLPPVSTTLGKMVAKFQNIQNGPNVILWGWGETDSRKKQEAKNLVTLSL
jgi:hypothetical protein